MKIWKKKNQYAPCSRAYRTSDGCLHPTAAGVSSGWLRGSLVDLSTGTQWAEARLRSERQTLIPLRWTRCSRRWERVYTGAECIRYAQSFFFHQFQVRDIDIKRYLVYTSLQTSLIKLISVASNNFDSLLWCGGARAGVIKKIDFTGL